VYIKACNYILTLICIRSRIFGKTIKVLFLIYICSTTSKKLVNLAHTRMIWIFNRAIDMGVVCFSIYHCRKLVKTLEWQCFLWFRTLLMRVLNEIESKYEMINDKRLTLHEFVFYFYTIHTYSTWYSMSSPVVAFKTNEVQ